MAQRRRKSKRGKWVGRALAAGLALACAYLVAALVGSLIPVNDGWVEPARGTTVYIADNGIHADLIMPVRAQGLDWSREIPRRDFTEVDGSQQWIAFGSGERHVYLDTPTWSKIRPHTIWTGLAGGPRIIHVEYLNDHTHAVRQVRIRPEEYRRLWASVRADFARDSEGQLRHIRRSGYGEADTFFEASGHANALWTCNVVLAHWLRLAGIKTSIWPPFVDGLVWRYRKTRPAS